MAEKPAPQADAAPPRSRKWLIVGGAVLRDEKARIERARQVEGAETMSKYVRAVMLRHADLVLDPPPRRREDRAA